METTKTALQQKAEEAASWFEQTTRPGQEEKIWTMKDGRPQWVHEMVYKAHEGMLPDDWRYAFVVEALDRIMESDDPEAAADEIEADTYTTDLLKWLSSNLNRTAYVDEAVNEYGGEPGSIVDQLILGQVAEKREVYQSVLRSLRAQEVEPGVDSLLLSRAYGPFDPEALCECGHTADEHANEEGPTGACNACECPSFKEVD